MLNACRTSGIYSSPSSLSEAAAIKMLSDHEFLDRYIQTNQQRLSAAYSYIFSLLKHDYIEYAPGGTAAMFVYINLGKNVWARGRGHAWRGPPEDEQGLEKEIFRRLMEKGIFVVSGREMGAEEPGWFWVCFIQDRDVVREGVRRIVEAVHDMVRTGEWRGKGRKDANANSWMGILVLNEVE